MSKVNNILGQLQDRLNMKFNSPKTMEGSLSGGSEFINQYPPKEDYDKVVPDVSNTFYVTHRAFVLPTGGKRGNKLPFESKNLKEQEEDEEEKTPEVSEEQADEEMPEETDVGDETMDTGGLDAGMGDAGGDYSAMGGGIPGMEPEEPKTAGQLGRIYELKKIYTRLTSIESYLGNESTAELIEIRDLVSKSIELFEIISSNFDSYKDRLDEIIVTYYKFITEVYNNVRDHFKKAAK